MLLVVRDFETSIHPHGCKWWRYRYQYSAAEAIVLMCIYPCVWALTWLLMSCGGFTNALQERDKTRNPNAMYSYIHLAFLFHATAVAIAAFVAWALYWSTDLWDWFALSVRWVLDADNPKSHWWGIPYYGQTYYWMVTEILFHIFAGFALFTGLIIGILRRFTIARDMWKEMELQDIHGQSKRDHIHYSLVKAAWVRNCRVLAIGDEAFREVLNIDGFKFYRYLTIALNDSAAALSMPSIVTVVVMFLYFVAILWLSVWYKLPGLFFMVPLLIISFVFFLVSYAIDWYLQRVTLDRDPPATKAPMPWLTIWGFSTSVQVVLVVLCYTFSRLIFSRFIWMYYYWVAVQALVGFALLFIFVWIMVAFMTKNIITCLSLPPNVKPEDLKEDMRAVANDESGDVTPRTRWHLAPTATIDDGTKFGQRRHAPTV
jgi:hypothetical protein